MCLIICRFIDVLDEMFQNVRGQRYFKYSYRKKQLVSPASDVSSLTNQLNI